MPTSIYLTSPSVHPSAHPHCPSVNKSVRTYVCPSIRPLPLFICLSIHLTSIRLSINPSVCLSGCPSLRPSISLSVCPSVHPSICLSVCPPDHPSVRPSISHTFVCLSVCLCVHLSICLFVRRPSVHPSFLPTIRVSLWPPVRLSISAQLAKAITDSRTGPFLDTN